MALVQIGKTQLIQHVTGPPLDPRLMLKIAAQVRFPWLCAGFFVPVRWCVG